MTMPEELPSTPGNMDAATDLASQRTIAPQIHSLQGITPISKAIALLQHRSNATPIPGPGRIARTAELSARKAELASLLNQVKPTAPPNFSLALHSCNIPVPLHA